MNNKAFTLVELLAVIMLIFALYILVYPAIEKVFNSSINVVYSEQISNILKATYNYSLTNANKLPDSGDTIYITLGELKTLGLVDYDIKNPNNQAEFPNNLVISIENVGTKYKNSSPLAMLKGSYLYTVEIDNLESTELEPSISITGVTQNSDGNYIKILDLNDEFNINSYSALANDEITDLTDRVKYYILKGENIVSSVTTSESGIYKVNYFVVDDSGYGTTSELNLIIADTSKPSITLPEHNTISVNESSFDLLLGVTCTDNSGFCNITYTGTVEYGTAGKYIIEYTAQDPSGNTETARRVITIK